MPLTYQAIATVTVGAGGAATVTFSNIPQTFTDLVIKLSARSSVASGTNMWEDIGIAFNGGTVNSSISTRGVFGYSSTVGSASSVTWPAGFAASSIATSSTFSNNDIYIPNYTSSVAKSFSVDTSSETNGAAGINALLAGLWNNTAAITSIGLSITTGSSPLFVQNSTATLYGIKNS